MNPRQLELLKNRLKLLIPDPEFPIINPDPALDMAHIWEGIQLGSIMRACKESSWDFPSFISNLCPHDPEAAPEDQIDPDEMPMHPCQCLELIKIFTDIDPSITVEDFEFDT